MKFTSHDDLLLHELQDLYSAENQITQALPKMAEKATNQELKDGFNEHLEQTKGQIKRLQQIAEKLEVTLEGEKCEGMEGLIKEGKKLLEEDANEFLDQALIGAAQRVEHYEIAGYGCAATYAKLLGYDEVLDLLLETLQEEKETNEKLTEIAESEQTEI